MRVDIFWLATLPVHDCLVHFFGIFMFSQLITEVFHKLRRNYLLVDLHNEFLGIWVN